MSVSQDFHAHRASSVRYAALALLLGINLFNYIDRYVLAAVVPLIQQQFFPNNPPNAEAWMGALATAFIVSYMLMAPIFGVLADRVSRWRIVGVGVLLWSLATAASGATGAFGGFALLLITRLFVGVGEAGYGPAAPTLIADYFPPRHRGLVMSVFYLAIPVGSALGYTIGGAVAQRHGWPMAFYAVVAPGIVMGAVALFFDDPQRGAEDIGHAVARRASLDDYLALLRNRSYVLNSLGMTAMTFAIGGIAFWMPKYLVDVRHLGDLATATRKFGMITVVSGFLATILGGIVGDIVGRWIGSAYLLVSAIAMFIACPFVLMMLHAPPGRVWVYLFVAVFFLFFNTGPTNTVLANVTPPSVRATAFALNILIIHALGDAVAPPVLGKIGHTSWDSAFYLVAIMMAASGLFWLWGCRYVVRDSAAIVQSTPATPRGFDVLPASPE